MDKPTMLPSILLCCSLEILLRKGLSTITAPSSNQREYPHLQSAAKPLGYTMASLDGKTYFFDLPAELRNLIYRLALPVDQRFGHRYQPAFLVRSRQSPRSLPPSTAPTVKRQLNRHERPGFIPGLLLASKQIRAEAAPIFYLTNEIQIDAKLEFNRLATLPNRFETDYKHAFEFVRELKITINLHIKPDEHPECGCVADRTIPVIKILITLSKGRLTGDVSWTAPSRPCPEEHWWPQVEKVWRELYVAVKDTLESAQPGVEIRDETEVLIYNHRGGSYQVDNLLSKGGWPRRVA
jgi:hypothetical protein